MPIYEYRCSAAATSSRRCSSFPTRRWSTCPACGKDDADQAGVGGGLPAQGQRLVRDRLQQSAASPPPRRRRRQGRPPATRRRTTPSRREAGHQDPTPSPTPSPRAAKPKPRPTAAATATPAATGTASTPATDAPRALAMKRYLIAGLLVWVPLGITIWVLRLPRHDARPDRCCCCRSARAPRRCSASTSRAWACCSRFAILLLTGVVAANFFGARLIRVWESLLGRIPFVKSIYSSVKQVSDTLLSDPATRFARRCWSNTRIAGSWTIAFQTGTPAARGRARTRRASTSASTCRRRRTRRRAISSCCRAPRARARHDRRRSAEVHHLDGRRRAAPHCGRRPPATAAALTARPKPVSTIPKLTADRRARASRARRIARCPRPPIVRPRPFTSAGEHLKRTDYCGRIDRRYLGQTVTVAAGCIAAATTAASSSSTCATARAWCRSSAIPIAPRPSPPPRSCATSSASRVTGLVRPRPEGTVNAGLQRRDRGARARDRDPQRVADAAVPDRRREHVGDRAPRAPRARPAPAADAEEPDAAPPRRDGGAPLPRRARLHRHRDADALQVARPKARASSSCRRASTTASSTRCRSRRSCSSRC